MKRFPSTVLMTIFVWFFILLAASPRVVAAAASGEKIFRSECETCHGPAAQGGHEGEYPRLAGLPQGYLAAQLRAFRDRTRQNKPMIPIFESGSMKDEEIAAVSEFLAGLPVPAIASNSERERALLADIETEEAGEPDLEWGRAIYKADCALCHGRIGEGKEETDNPPLMYQYPRYLVKQIGDFVTEERWHEFAKPLFRERDAEEIQAMLAYLFEIARGEGGD